ncbi:uncharacterized protein LOC113352132 [Papaver somniferum]|uniref:uncharacterized protein LOC113352132 n=1 Tax=Papaver somniferum TaxID=3469 RepID=UPI000E6FB5EA|nr:uncharacterized protein LOC113352132 [Papaver somniferum]
MSSKLISWNLRGLNAYDKQVALRDMIAAHRCMVCSIQETKIQHLSSWFVRQIWYDSYFGWDFIPSQGSVGNSGGLLTIWDSANLELLDKKVGLNSISCLLRYRSTSFKFIVTNAYSPCDFNLREDFWRDLAEIRNWSAEAWCFAGDLIAVRSDAERNKPGGDTRNMAFLNNFIMEQELIDFPLNGGAFTWSNKHADPTLCRLDRFLVCTLFDAKFSGATQTALVRTISDHNALLLDLTPDFRCAASFKIENHWLKHPDFIKLVEIWWRTMVFEGTPYYVLFRKLQNLIFFIKAWSREVFGNVKKERMSYWRRLKL